MIAPLLLLACAARQLPSWPAPPAPPEAARLMGTVETLAEERFNRGRQRALEERLRALGLPVEVERIDLYTRHKNLLVELPGES
ncbi:MAG: hypothetical protein H6741_35660, partial [Alphaproteobacteria bacterium]|nr:hypothetical protein [Alphaproteobacteria bacterium]